MSFLMVAFVDLKEGADVSWVPEYQANVGKIAKLYGGSYVGLSKAPPSAVECVEGATTLPQGISIARFRSRADIDRFLESPEYAPLRAARLTACDGYILAFENDDGAPHFKP